MTAPTFIAAGAGVAITTVNGSPALTTADAGDFLVLQILQDGTGASATVTAAHTRISDLAGTASAMTLVGVFDVGNPAAAKQIVYVARVNATGNNDCTVNSSSGDDYYARFYRFADVSTGTTLATVIENGSAGSTANGTGTSATASDTGVTTLGVDRLALNLIGINDDNPIAVFSGQSGGTWAEPVAEFASATGTDGSIGIQTAAMATAGTINGGTASITDSDGWGVIGFALIGTTVAAAANPPRSTQMTQLLAH